LQTQGKKRKKKEKKKNPKPFSNQMFQCICFWRARGQAARPALRSLPARSPLPHAARREFSAIRTGCLMWLSLARNRVDTGEWLRFLFLPRLQKLATT